LNLGLHSQLLLRELLKAQLLSLLHLLMALRLQLLAQASLLTQLPFASHQ